MRLLHCSSYMGATCFRFASKHLRYHARRSEFLRMHFPRSSGILLHPTSLPGAYGIGELGQEAHAFADFLRDSGQHIWQVLPLGPTGYGDSPYQCFSAFAGNPLLISLERLVEQGLLPAASLSHAPSFSDGAADYGRVIPWKMDLL